MGSGPYFFPLRTVVGLETEVNSSAGGMRFPVSVVQ